MTGINTWVMDGAFISWLIHITMALMATPLLFGHIYMAAFNHSTRVGLGGMITGWVDKRWAQHHYTHWYNANFTDEEDEVTRRAKEDISEVKNAKTWLLGLKKRQTAA